MQGFGHRITRQQVLADFADSALRLDDLDRILVEACRIAGDILGTGQVKLLELQDGGTLFRVRAGVGPCTVGQAWGPVDDQSPEARAVATGQPILVPDTGTGSHAAVVQGGNAAALASVPILRPGGRPYGVLQAYGPAPPAFAAEDVQALRACAAILGLAVERLLKPGDGQVEDDQFRLAAETALDHAIILTDAGDRVTAWFPGAAAVFGWTRDEMLGQPVSVLSTPGDREAWQDAAETEAAEAHESAPTGRWRLRKDGVRVFIDGTVRVLRDKGGAVRGFLRIGQDATAKHGADEALRASEDRFRGFAENSADTLWIANDTGETLDYLSPAFERMFGAERGPIMADTSRLIDLVHPEDRPRFLAAMPRAAAGEMVIVHYRILRPDGRTVWMRDTGFPIRAADGTQRNVAGVVQDITDIELARAALMDEKERFRTLAEGIPQLVWRSCDQGMWTWASPQWLDYTGQEQEESHGLGWLDVLHPDDREAPLQAWQGANSRGSMESEYRVRRASDGAYRWHRSRSAPLFAEPGGKDSGRIVEWLGTSTDIDDLKRLQQRGEVLVAELQHRTRNLLAVVRAISARNFPRSPERDEFDGRLAALSRVQGFLSRSSGWSVPLADLVAAELAATGDGASAKVEVKGPPIDLPGDRVQPVALALHELATNAMKYGALRQPQGRLKVQWRLEQHDGAPRLVLDWRESGIEMPAEPPARRGYGTELIERALPYQLRAKTRLVFGHDGVHCTIMLPLHPDMGGTGQ